MGELIASPRQFQPYTLRRDYRAKHRPLGSNSNNTNDCRNWHSCLFLRLSTDLKLRIRKRYYGFSLNSLASGVHTGDPETDNPVTEWYISFSFGNLYLRQSIVSIVYDEDPVGRPREYYWFKNHHQVCDIILDRTSDPSPNL